MTGGQQTESGLKAVATLKSVYANWVPEENIITTNLWYAERYTIIIIKIITVLLPYHQQLPGVGMVVHAPKRLPVVRRLVVTAERNLRHMEDGGVVLGSQELDTGVVLCTSGLQVSFSAHRIQLLMVGE